MGRRQRSRRQRLILDLVLGLIVLGLGCVGLFVAWQIRPAEFRNQPSGGAVPEVGEIQVTRMADTPDWLAWPTAHPFCLETGRTEEIARQHVAQAVQLGMRAECVWTPGDEIGYETEAAAGWYVDPLKTLGEGTLRYWDGHSWGDLWTSKDAIPPGGIRTAPTTAGR
jgi:hypothetical protein